MKRPDARILLVGMICVLFLASLTACSASGRAVLAAGNPKPEMGPPSHAPAHGYRAKHTYRYYPGVEVYFDISRKLYFYQEGPRWSASVSLPAHIHAKLGDYVMIAMDSEVPYVQVAEHRHKYPPGQMKKWK